MSKNLKQVALIQHRSGKLNELPTQLNQAEFGFALDTNDLFIGNPSNPTLAERIDQQIFPYGNVQILTEFTDNLEMIKYQYKDDNSKLPIYVEATTQFKGFAEVCSIKFDDVEVSFTTSMTINDIIDTINTNPQLVVKAQSTVDNRLVLISTNSILTLENSEFPTGFNPIQSLGFGDISPIMFIGMDNPSRSLQDVLSDRLSIKDFGVSGNISDDDSMGIKLAFLSVCKSSNENFKQIYFPSGHYKITDTIPLPQNLNIYGEGIDKTIIKGENLFDKPMFATMDSAFNLSTSSSYLKYGSAPNNITISNLTIDMSETQYDMFNIGESSSLTFDNVKFINNNGKQTFLITGNVNDLKISDSVFNNGYVIYSDKNIINGLITNNTFNNVLKVVELTDESLSSNILFDNLIFEMCGEDKSTLISLGLLTSNIRSTNLSVIDNRLLDIIIYESNSLLNYCDYYSNVDEKTFLRYYDNQPAWEYVDLLANPKGQPIIDVKYSVNIDGSIVDSLGGLNLYQADNTNNNTTSLLGSTPTINVNIGAGKYGNVTIGDFDQSYKDWAIDYEYKLNDIVEFHEFEIFNLYQCVKDHTSTDITELQNTELWLLISTVDPSVVLERNIDLKEQRIKSSTANVQFETTPINYLSIYDNISETDLPYADRIGEDKNAIPNLDYINRKAQRVIKRIIPKISEYELEAPRIKICDFPSKDFGGEVYINSISLNIRTPYIPLLEQIFYPLIWKPLTEYSIGDIIRHNSINYSCKTAHTSTENFDDDFANDMWFLIEAPTTATQWKEGLSYKTGDVVYNKWRTVESPSPIGDNNTDCYMCIKDHYSDLINEAENGDDSGKYWLFVTQQSRSGTDTGTFVTPTDAKYITMIADNGDTVKRLMFPKDLIDVSVDDSDINSYLIWKANTDYQEGDIVNYKYRNYKCIAPHTSSIDVREVYDESLWQVLFTNGFNYVFDFDRAMDLLDYDTELPVGDNFVSYYNFSDYTLWLDILDESGNQLPIIAPVGFEKVTDMKGEQEIGWVDTTTNIAYYDDDSVMGVYNPLTGIITNADGEEVGIFGLSKWIQISANGSIIATVDFAPNQENLLLTYIND